MILSKWPTATDDLCDDVELSWIPSLQGSSFDPGNLIYYTRNKFQYQPIETLELHFSRIPYIVICRNKRQEGGKRMNAKVLETLEYDKIIQQLAGYASSEMGKNQCRKLLPSDQPDEILRAQGETRDALSRVYRHGNLSFSGLADIRPHLRLLEISSTLSTRELLEIARLLAVAAQAKEYGLIDSVISHH